MSSNVPITNATEQVVVEAEVHVHAKNIVEASSTDEGHCEKDVNYNLII